MVVTTSRRHADLFPFANVVEIPFDRHPLVGKVQYKLRCLDLEFGFRNPAFGKAFAAVVADFRPDVIHCHFGAIAPFVYVNYRLGNIPFFVSFHGYDASHKLDSARYRKMIRDLLNQKNVCPIFVSNFMHRYVEEKIGKVNTPNILYYGTDIACFTRTTRKQQKDPFIFLQVSSFMPKKGHEYTLRAYQKFLHSTSAVDTHLVLAGDGPLRSGMMQLAQQLGLDGKVDFPGHVTPAGAKKLMDEAHCFVHHSITPDNVTDREGIPNAIMEAMAMELPILSTRHAGIPELVEDGVHGYLVDERDTGAYATSMAKIIAWDYCPPCREKVTRQFERRQHARDLMEIYQKACGIHSCNG
ncbi:MAG: glycosyltransferase family 4 protein [Bacteroidales bacterium]|nr:glycosyltransferase family 4 protein [Bacteroidales bacterium]